MTVTAKFEAPHIVNSWNGKVIQDAVVEPGHHLNLEQNLACGIVDTKSVSYVHTPDDKENGVPNGYGIGRLAVLTPVGWRAETPRELLSLDVDCHCRSDIGMCVWIWQ